MEVALVSRSKAVSRLGSVRSMKPVLPALQLQSPMNLGMIFRGQKHRPETSTPFYRWDTNQKPKTNAHNRNRTDDLLIVAMYQCIRVRRCTTKPCGLEGQLIRLNDLCANLAPISQQSCVS
jgi:hypothetical protein